MERRKRERQRLLARFGDPREADLRSAIAFACNTYGEKIFLSFLEDGVMREVSFTAFFSRVREWAAFLRERGVGKGDRVAFLSPKSPRQIVLFYACWRIGAVAVPVSETLAELETGFILRDCEPSLVIVDDTLQKKISEFTDDENVVLFSALPQDFEQEAEQDDSDLPEISPDDLAALIYTSGSTGIPKGVMLTHRNLLVNAFSALESISLGGKDTIYSLLPYWHAFAMLAEVILSPMAGLRVAIAGDKREFKQNIARFAPTVMLVVPRIASTLKTGVLRKMKSAKPKLRKLFSRGMANAETVLEAGPGIRQGMWAKIARYCFYEPILFRRIRAAFGGQLRFMVAGGAPLDEESQRFFRKLGIPLYQGYGLTECSPVISVEGEEFQHPGSCGRMLSWLQSAYDGDFTFCDDDGQYGKDRVGELLVKGDCVMKGYWRHQDQSAKKMTDGWLHTGDVGYMDEDRLLFLCGRQNNMLVLAGGEKLHPEHVEDALKRSPLISEAMLVGDQTKNVYVVVNLDETESESIPEDEIQSRLRQEIQEYTQHLAAHQRPKDALVLPDFSIDDGTLTATFKVRRHNVWEKYGDHINEFIKSREGGE